MTPEPESASGLPVRYIDPRKAAVYLAWTLAFAYSFAPFDFVVVPDRIAENVTLGEPLNLPYLVDLALHVLAFAAVGAADRLGGKKPGNRGFLPVLVRGLMFCLVIELGQIFVSSRHGEVADLAANGVGLLLGHLSVRAAAVRLRSNAWARTALILPTPRLRTILTVIWALIWSSLLLLPSRFVTLDDWDPGYPLVIGHERNGDHAWKGDVQYIALYDRALQPGQVSRSFDHRPAIAGATLARLSMGLLVAYDFTRVGRLEVEPEGRLDVRDLRVHLPYGSRWNAGNPAALVLGERGLLASAGSAELLTTLIASSGTFSVEVWCRPAELSQSGAAPIVGVSDSMWRNNFTLGQEGQDLYFRVRNRLNGLDGSRFELRSPDALSTNLVQIVATYAQGVSSVFENGQRLGPTVDMREPSVLLGLGTGPASRFVTALLSALSLIFLSCCFLERRATALGVVRLFLLGYSCLLLPLVFGLLFSFGTAVSLYMWFGPALVLSSALVLGIGRR